MTHQHHRPSGMPGAAPAPGAEPSSGDPDGSARRSGFTEAARTVLGLASTGRSEGGFPHSSGSDPDRAFLFDVATGLLLAASCGLVDSTYGGSTLLASLGLTLPWVVRRRWPLVALIVATLAALFQLVVSEQPLFAIVAVPALIYTFARWTNRTFARTGLAVGLAGSFLGPIRWALPTSPASIGVFVVTALACSGLVALAYVIGSRRRERAERVHQAVQTRIERERLMAAEQEQRSRVATINERNRIARELHDIVAHSLSVIVVQAEGGRALATKRPEKAPEVLSTIADTSREALAEMRQMVGLLRSGGAPGETGQAGSPESYLPTPGLDDLPDLVARTGDRFDLTEYGARPAVSQALGLSVYRVVQESLTNVLKHAGPSAHAAVGVTYAPEGIGIRVVDNGKGPDATSDGKGHGVRGMGERVALHGGTVSALPRAGGGFEVLAWLPYPAHPGFPERPGYPEPAAHRPRPDHHQTATGPMITDPRSPQPDPTDPYRGQGARR